MERSLAAENEILFKSFKEKNKHVNFHSFTPTNYQELDVESIYHLLIE